MGRINGDNIRNYVQVIAVDKADRYGETGPSPVFTGCAVTLPLNADYTDLSGRERGSANFALSFTPFNITEGWAGYDDTSVFDLKSGPPEWVIRNGLNGLPPGRQHGLH
jgi:hypothetical protein